MQKEQLRILIAEPKPRRRLALEHLLNAEGCYGICTARNREDVMKLIACGFDLIVIESTLFGSDQSELARHVLARDRAQHVLCYRSDDRAAGAIEAKRRHRTLLVNMPGVPGTPVLRRVIERALLSGPAKAPVAMLSSRPAPAVPVRNPRRRPA